MNAEEEEEVRGLCIHVLLQQRAGGGGDRKEDGEPADPDAVWSKG